MHDVSRPVATSPDNPYSLTIEEAAALYANSGHPRTLRTVQRYCASGHLDCVKAATLLGDKYFVEPASVTRHIAQIDELIALDNRASRPGAPRHAAPPITLERPDDGSRPVAAVVPSMSAPVANLFQKQATFPDEPSIHDASRHTATDNASLSRPDAATAPDVSRQVALLEREVERLSEDRSFLRQQIATKDEQISALLERDRETNILVRTLQQMLSPLLGSGRTATDDKGDTPSFG